MDQIKKRNSTHIFFNQQFLEMHQEAKLQPLWGPGDDLGLSTRWVQLKAFLHWEGGGDRDGSGWKKMSWGAVVEGGPTTHDAATLSAPLKVPYLLICISKQAADNFKVSTPMRPDAGMDLCLSMCAGMCVCVWVCVCIYLPACLLCFISWEYRCEDSNI